MVKGLESYAGKRILVTGHTGFKGSWLCLWLQALGAHVFGYSLEPSEHPWLFGRCDAPGRIEKDCRGDIRDAPVLGRAMDELKPDCVFHLAAQPLVRRSYQEPVETWTTNLAGTLNLLEACRNSDSLRALVVVTTDKCYENQERKEPYRESDRLGGRDPYSASKAAVELLTSSYRDCFLRPAGIRVATARAGNVIGGGDVSEDRLVPDALRAFAAGQTLILRNPAATRPWQHVLDPLCGYLLLGARLLEGSDCGVDGAWNFGPDSDGTATVGEVAERLAAIWGGGKVANAADPNAPHEAGLLHLDASRAKKSLGWIPRWSLQESLDRTVSWYRCVEEGANPASVMDEQIQNYSTVASSFQP